MSMTLPKYLIVKGLASQKKIIFSPTDTDLELNLMNYLMKQGLPIASSCSGQGACQRCVVNNELLSCQISVREYLAKFGEVEITYL